MGRVRQLLIEPAAMVNNENGNPTGDANGGCHDDERLASLHYQHARLDQ